MSNITTAIEAIKQKKEKPTHSPPKTKYFKKGDRVKSIVKTGMIEIGDKGTMLQSNNCWPWVEFDKQIHSNNMADAGPGKKGHCFPMYPRNLKLIN